MGWMKLKRNEVTEVTIILYAGWIYFTWYFKWWVDL